jgi:hypothetical protein
MSDIRVKVKWLMDRDLDFQVVDKRLIVLNGKSESKSELKSRTN